MKLPIAKVGDCIMARPKFDNPDRIESKEKIYSFIISEVQGIYNDLAEFDFIYYVSFKGGQKDGFTENEVLMNLNSGYIAESLQNEFIATQTI